MKNLFLSFAVIIILGSCSTGTSPDSVHKNGGIKIKYLDKQGNSLLNPEHQNTITEQNTDLYYQENGEKKIIYEGTRDAPKGFYIQNNYEYMHLFPWSTPDQNSAITFIEFSDSSMDTIKVKYDLDEKGNFYLRKVWYNQNLIPEGKEGYRFEIIKNKK